MAIPGKYKGAMVTMALAAVTYFLLEFTFADKVRELGARMRFGG